MATNAASYNPSKNWTMANTQGHTDTKPWIVGAETGPVSGDPPALSTETKAAVAGAAESDPTGSHVPGQDAGSKVGTVAAADGEKKVKTEKECADVP